VHVVSEHQSVGADGKRHSETSECVQGGLGGTGLVAVELGGVDARTFGQHGLGEIAISP
jgi:hypothetical protein